jgi:hypothetical protein
MLPVPSIAMNQTARISLRRSKLSKSAGTDIKPHLPVHPDPAADDPARDASRIDPAGPGI